MVEYTLGKKERLNSKTLIERLFSGGSKSFPAFPLRVVYMSVEPVEEDMAAASILISVPKKRFKRAVKRNLVKRQVREAYRKNKHLLLDALASRNKRLIIAFIWLDNHIHSSAEVEEKVKKLLVSYSGKAGMKKILSYLLLLPVYFYRGYISPMTPPSCRFVPTCSEYAIEAIKKHGPFKGLYLAVRRILRCHPWGGSGYDPVP